MSSEGWGCLLLFYGGLGLLAGGLAAFVVLLIVGHVRIV